MTIKVGSARIDENGKVSGGAAGDQTKKEVSTQDYYMHSKGWYLIRPKSAEDADKLAASMLAACENDNIGYDQNERQGIITQIKKYGSMAKIAVKTEADCGTLVRGCCIEAGFDPGNFTTVNEAEALSKTGRFENKVAVTSSTVICNGDVLVTKTKGHTVIVTEGNPRKAGTAAETPFKVRVDISDLVIRTGAGTEYAGTGEHTGRGVFTITEVKEGKGSMAGWGKLKSGAGWISLDHAVRL